MLTVYKASAGSGKTFRLAVEYIKRLIENTNSYENILAVTFTNKATEEMKMRILSQLYGLSRGLKSSNGYLDAILKDFKKAKKNITAQDVRTRSGIALERMLHNYNFFRVETIDRFFQTVLKNLARELDLTPNLRVELGDKEIEYQAVDSLIDNLHEGDKVLKWIIDFIQTSVNDDKSWNVIGSIKTFAETIFKDEYKEIAGDLTERLNEEDGKKFTEFINKMNSLRANAVPKANLIANQLWNIIKDSGYTISDFSGGTRGIGNWISKLPTTDPLLVKISKSAEKCLDPNDTNAEAWYNKKAPQAFKDFCRNTMRPAFITKMKEFLALQNIIKSVKTTMQHMSQIRLLNAIEKEIRKNNEANDRFLLSDTQTLLNKMIDGSDSPFIYEKIGANLHNIMIDEFQDTSRIQWRNFKVLIDNCLASGYDNLIVGDVKQSIYRWRSGDWRLLGNISNEFTEEIKIDPLSTNYRSSKCVIDFNNAFFTKAAGQVHKGIEEHCKPEDAEMLKNAYSDVKQKYPDKKEDSGYVQVELLDGKDNYDQTMLNRVSDTITELIDRGINQNDIAILVRTNKHIPLIAAHCQEVLPDVTIVSDEAFLLSASVAVQIIINAMRHLANPEDGIIRATLSVCYQSAFNTEGKTKADMLTSLSLPEAFTSQRERLASLPLYQMAEELFHIFQLDQLDTQSAYICCFFDAINEFIKSSVADTKSFINYWDEKLNKKKIESDTENGIRILSIHKSKGLEFGYVIMPYCDWQLELSGTLWCKPTVEPYNTLNAVPLNYSSEMLNTIYEPYYWEEHLQNEVDNLNLLYVGFTRAVNGLFVFSKAGQKDTNRAKLIEDCIKDETLQTTLNATLTDGLFTCGTLPSQCTESSDEKDKEPEQNVFLKPFVSHEVNIKTSTTLPEFRQSNQSKEFTLTDKDEDELQRNQYIKLGNVLHSLFANIRTIDDIPAAILRLEMEGQLFGQDITADYLQQQIEKSLRDPLIRSWFDSRWTLHNECTILEYDKTNNTVHDHRPDRVMTCGDETIIIDFKLSHDRDAYHDQLNRYASLLNRMGYKNIRKYLFFLLPGKYLEVK